MFHLFHGKHHQQHQQQHDPNSNSDPFPTPADLPHLPPDIATTALRVLRGMVLIDTAHVYTAAAAGSGSGSHGKSWQVWLDITQRRVTLEQWADEWLQKQYELQQELARKRQHQQQQQQRQGHSTTPTNGGDAA